MPRELTLETVLNSGLRLLSYRQRTRQELVMKLRHTYKDRLDDQMLDLVLGRLDELGFLDDDQFAIDFVRAKVERGKGPRWIHQALLQKGMDPASVNRVLGEVDTSVWVIQAKRMLEKRATLLERKPVRQRSQYAWKYLSQRGFETATIRAVIDEMGL